MRGSRARAAAALALLLAAGLAGGLAAEHAASSELEGCPDTEQGRALAGAARHAGEAPFLFRRQRLDICPGSTSEHDCAHPLPYRWAQFCEFDRAAGGGWAAYMVCDEARQASVIDYYRGKAALPNLDAMLAFSPCELWPLVRTRTLWVVGDSHSYDLFHALACFLGGLWDYGFAGKYPYEGEGEGFAHLEAHVEHYKPPECLALAEGTLVCQVRVNRGAMLVEHVLPMLARMARPSDIVVANVAHWHNGWEGTEYRDLLVRLRDEVAEHAAELPHFVWKEMVATHYPHLHGAYKGGTPPFKCKPLGAELQQDGTLATDDYMNELLLEGGAHNKVARQVFAGTDIAMTACWNATLELWDYHRELADGRGHECGHYCFPGVPEVYLYHVYLAIQSAPWRDRL